MLRAPEELSISTDIDAWEIVDPPSYYISHPDVCHAFLAGVVSDMWEQLQELGYRYDHIQREDRADAMGIRLTVVGRK